MLKRLYVDNVRCLSNFELVPGQVAGLVGPNGGGKSALFDVLRSVQALLHSTAQPVAALFPFLSRTRWVESLDQTIELEAFDRELGSFHYRLKIHHEAKGRDATLSEELIHAGEVLYRFVDGVVQLFGDRVAEGPRANFPADPRRSFLPVLEPREDNQRIHAFKRWLSGILLFRIKPDRIVFETDTEVEMLDHEAANFVAWYRSLQQEMPQITSQILEDVRPYIPGLTGIRLAKFYETKRAMVVDTLQAGRTVPLSVIELSDGQRALLVLYTILRAAAHRASLLVFDEPDNFIAQAEIQPWLSELRERVVEASLGTLLVISHHPEVIDYLAPDQILRLWRDDGPTRIRSLNDDLDLSEGLRASEALQMGLGGAE